MFRGNLANYSYIYVMKYSFLPIIALALLSACSCPAPTGASAEGPAWLFLDKGPYTLETKVDMAGPARMQLVTDLSLMADEPEVVLEQDVTIGPDSLLTAPLGKLDPGFYQVRLNDTLRFNIGVQPDLVSSPVDAAPDFDAFWEGVLADVAALPMDAEFIPVPEQSNELRETFIVKYTSIDGALSGGILCVPVAPGKYPVLLSYMGYGAPIFYFDPSANPERIDFLVSVRDQGIFREEPYNWADRGLASRDTYYYKGAFADARRAVDFIAGYEKADPSRIVACGESQGGALTVAAAALDSRIKAIAPAVPFLGDYRDYYKIVWWPVHEITDAADAEGLDREELFDMLSYFDIKNLAPRVKCPAYMAFGLQDPTCPPHTNFAIYNNLGSAQKHFWCVPTCGHAMWLEPSWPPIRDAFLEEYM